VCCAANICGFIHFYGLVLQSRRKAPTINHVGMCGWALSAGREQEEMGGYTPLPLWKCERNPRLRSFCYSSAGLRNSRSSSSGVCVCLCVVGGKLLQALPFPKKYLPFASTKPQYNYSVCELLPFAKCHIKNSHFDFINCEHFSSLVAACSFYGIHTTFAASSASRPKPLQRQYDSSCDHKVAIKYLTIK